jgi:hypothetical protein
VSTRARLARALGAALHRRPRVRATAATAIVVLTMGIAIGATIAPATVGQSAAGQAPLLVVSAPRAAPAAGGDAAETVDAGAGSSADAASPADAVVGLGSDAGGDESAASAPAESTDVPAGDEGTEEGTAGDGTGDDGTGGDGTGGDGMGGDGTGRDGTGEGTGDDGAAGQPAAAPPPGSLALAGVVLAADANRFTLAGRDGALREIHASGCGVQPGDDLHLRARQLANGTWSADRVRRLPRPARRLAAVGVVSWVDAANGRYVLGARGTTLLVTIPAPAAPALGERVRVAFEAPAERQAGGSPAVLVERRRTTLPLAADPAAAPAPPLELRGRVAAVDPQARTLALALDPADPATTTLTLTLPSAIQPATIHAAQDVAVTATPDPAGGYALTGISPDDDASAADDPSAIQGDQVPSNGSTGDAGSTTVSTCTLLTARA